MLAGGQDAPALNGWRRTVFGEKAEQLTRGELALAVRNKRVVVFIAPADQAAAD